jgi:hypothetical protein
MEQRFKGQAGMGARGKNQPVTKAAKKNRTSKRSGISPGRRTRPSADRKKNQGRNQKEWAAEKRMAARY